MKVIVLVIAVGLGGLCGCVIGFAQPATIQLLGPQGAGLLGTLPQEVLPKIEQLARLLQQNLNDGMLSEDQIRKELNQGDLAELIRGLNPEARQLLDDISASLRANHSEEVLSLLLGGLMGKAQ